MQIATNGGNGLKKATDVWIHLALAFLTARSKASLTLEGDSQAYLSVFQSFPLRNHDPLVAVDELVSRPNRGWG